MRLLANALPILLFLAAGGAGLGALAATYAAAWRITDERHRLRLDRLRQK
jgi:putative ABC transport system permease protein